MIGFGDEDRGDLDLIVRLVGQEEIRLAIVRSARLTQCAAQRYIVKSLLLVRKRHEQRGQNVLPPTVFASREVRRFISNEILRVRRPRRR